jgi:hypothetical protein
MLGDGRRAEPGIKRTTFLAGSPYQVRMPGDLMRRFIVTFTFVAQITAVFALPLSMSPEQPVSSPAFGPAAGNQQTLGVASNGQIGFAVWLDQRRGSTDLYGSRIDPAGAALDPLGILIATGVTGGNVIWNGTEFVAISERGSDKTFTFMTTDGVITARKSVLLLYNQLAATLGSGPEARILFIGLGLATIVDSSGNVVIANVQTGMPVSDSLRAAAGGTSEFLVLHTMLVPGTHLFAERIDRDGNVLSSAKDTGVDLSVFGNTLALAGADDDYLLIGRGPIERAVLGVHLDRNGVAKGAIKTFEAVDSTTRVSLNPPATPAVLRDGDVYEIAWTTSEANGSAHTSLKLEAALPVGLNPILAHPLQWTGMGYRATLAAIGSHRIIVTDAFRSGVSTTIDPIAAMFEIGLTVIGQPFDLASSATRQTSPQIAASASGYAVLWNEYGPDGAARLYLRRYLNAPLPGTVVPLDVASDANGQAIPAAIAASGDVYVIAWAASKTNFGSSNYVIRRISARTGAWLDAEPVPLATAYELVLAANLDGALAVYNVDCSSTRCLRARAIATDAGSPLRTAETTSASGAAYQLSIAGNGHEYLAAWNDNVCFFPCDVPFPSRILAQRLGQDGNALGSAPIVLDDTPQSFPASPWIAWDGSRYLVSWTRAASILGAHVSSSGISDSAREIYRRPSQLLSQKLVASGGNTLLFLTTQSGDAISTSVITVDPQSLVSFGELALVAAGQPPAASISIAVAPAGSLLLAYDRIDETDGFVGRAFTRAMTSSSRRRAAR